MQGAAPITNDTPGAAPVPNAPPCECLSCASDMKGIYPCLLEEGQS